MLTKKAERAAKEYARTTPAGDLCVAKVTSGDSVRPGPYLLLPILGSAHKTQAGRFVLLNTFLLRLSDERHVGVLNWLLPFNERTEAAIVKLLASLGWDGRVWPNDSGWPGTDTQEGVGLRTVLDGQGLLATLTFPPDAKNGNATLRQDILRTSANFPLSPHVDAKEPAPELTPKLRALALDPAAIFGTGAKF